MRIIPIVLSLISLSALAQLPKPSAGSIRRLENFSSKYVDARNVDVWLPDGYSNKKRYNVLYMHDGQMLFDSAGTWNHQEWKMDETITRLIRTGKMEDCIVVGIWNNGKYRHSEYFPQKYFDGMDEAVSRKIQNDYFNGHVPQSDNYLRFLVEELKPYIDKNFFVYKDKDHTYMMGSSMGGMISIYAMAEYPETFGAVACLSTAWNGTKDQNSTVPLAAFQYLNKKMPSPFGHRVYFDYGTVTLDSLYEVHQKFIDIILKEKGYQSSNWRTMKFANEPHTEQAWSRRVNIPLEFLLPKPRMPVATSGAISRFESFESKFVDPRTVDVWLPEGYNTKQKYAVLYMHDGQMLYDAATTWNKQAWEVDEVAGRLQGEGMTRKFIVVGVWNNGIKRHPEYFPQKPFETLPASKQDEVYALGKAANGNEIIRVQSDAYLKFLVEELKPFIDKNFSTLKDQKNTFVAGSSMGGLISMYAICEYPKVFGGAACLSTHWPGTFSAEGNPIPGAFMNYLKGHLPSPKSHKIYFDYGTATLDALYKPFQLQADEIMRQKGFDSKHWMTREFEGADHSEKAWHARLNIPMIFLLK